MSTIAVLGMGLLGRGFAEALLRDGHTVSVWNRTASKADSVVALGAKRADTPADAVRGADRIHLILSEDTAVDAVIAAMGDAVAGPIVDHSTNLPAKIEERVDRLAALGITYIHAPVFMGPANSRDATGMMLISGPSDVVEGLRPGLATMTGKVLYVGPGASKAAAMKLTGNALLFVLTSAMGDLFRMGAKNGLNSDDVMTLVNAFPVTPAAMGNRVLASQTAPVGFELNMARKDVRLMMASGAELTLFPAIAASMDRAIDAGMGKADFVALEHPEGRGA